MEYRNDITFTPDDDQEKRCLAQEIIITSANKVCLYLPDATRTKFRETFEHYVNFSPDFSGVISIETIKEIFAPKFELERKFQTLFEKVLTGEEERVD